METINLSLIVEFFKLDDIFVKGNICFFEAVERNGTLVDCPDTKDELAEVFVILVWEDAIEDTRAKSIDVEKQLPCLVTAQKFIDRISRGATE